MANIIQRPKVAIAGEFDGSPYVGAVYTRAGNAVTVAANTSSAPHSDIIAFLNGYGSRSGRDLGSIVDVSKPSAFTSLSCGIDESDRFYVEGSHTFTHAGSGAQLEASRAMFGFSGSETVTGSGPYRLTASGRWQRGVFQLDYDSVGGLKIAQTSTSSTATSFKYVSAESWTFNGIDAVLFRPMTSSFTSGATVSDFSVNDIISATSSSGATISYKIMNTVFSGGETYWVLQNTDGSALSYSASFSTHGFYASGTLFSGTVPVTSSVVTDVAPSNARVQNLVTWLRVRGSVSDADDVYSGKCLEDAEYTAGNTFMTCVLEADGRVSFNYPSTQAAYPTLTSIQTIGEALFLRLGFDGTETAAATTTNHRQLRGANRAPCVLATNRGYVELRREVLGRDDYTIMADGSVVSGGLTPIKGWRLIVRVYGPAHGYTVDLERHLREWWKYARRGLTIYPTFGDQASKAKGGNDTRRHVDLIGLYGTTAHHNLFQTVEADESATHFGKRVGGRLLVKRHPQDAQARREDYSFELDIHQDIMLRLLDDTSR